MANETMVDRLNRLVADATVFWFKLHNDHWFVAGPAFFRLHEKYEELYDRWGQVVDDLAERVLMLGGRPVGTLAGAIELASIGERTDTPGTAERVESTIEDLRALHGSMGEAIAEAEKADDRGTANMLDAVRDAIDKDVWMLKAFLTG